VLLNDAADRLCVVLVAARNPLNIGAAARAIGNFGFSRLRVVNPYKVPFREARSAVGASGVLLKAAEFNDVADAIADCNLVIGTTALQHRNPQHPTKRLEEGVRLIRRLPSSSKVALLFGSEKIGLTNQDLSHCHWLIRIPTQEKHPSMNLGQAVAICLYELVRNSRIPIAARQPDLASSAETERLTEMLLQALVISGYMNSAPATSMKMKVRRLVKRLHLPPDDIDTWLGMIRQFSWKMSQVEK
jgi:TrmH family RNA methyltransferase